MISFVHFSQWASLAVLANNEFKMDVKFSVKCPLVTIKLHAFMLATTGSDIR